MTFDVLKSLHIIFVVSWFAGLFYMVRLFIYHTEAQLKEENAKHILSDQFQIMEKKIVVGDYNTGYDSNGGIWHLDDHRRC